MHKIKLTSVFIGVLSFAILTFGNANAKAPEPRPTFDNVTVKRPASGLSPLVFEKILNKKSRKKYLPDEIIKIWYI